MRYQLLESLLTKHAKSDNSPCTILRNRYCGCYIDVKALSNSKFHCKENPANPAWDLWYYLYNKGSEGIVLKISKSELIGTIEHIDYVDIRDVYGFTAPVGYIRSQYGLSSVMQNRFAKILDSSITSRLPDNFPDTASQILRLFFEDYDELCQKQPGKTPYELLLDDVIGNFYSTKNYDRLVFVISCVFKYMSEFEDIGFVADLAGMYSVFGYKHEFFSSLQQMIKIGDEWPEGVYSVICTALWQSFRFYDVANKLAFDGLFSYPNSNELKSHLLYSGQFCIRDMCVKDEKENAIALGRRILQTTDRADDTSNFELIFGLACESAALYDEALLHYQKMITIKPSCGMAKKAISRLKEKEQTPIEAMRTLSFDYSEDGTIKTLEDPLINPLNSIN